MQEQAIADIDAVDERPPLGRLFILGLQHVLVMYAGNVAVPLLVAGALKLPPDQTAFLITADLFAAGVAAPFQSFGFWKFGARLPVGFGAALFSVGAGRACGLNTAIG